MTKHPTKKTAPPADAAPAISPAASTAAPSDGSSPSEGGGEAGGSQAIPSGVADGVQPARASSSAEGSSLSTGDAFPARPTLFMDAALNLADNLRQGDIVVSLDERIAALSPEDRDLLVMALAKAGHLQTQEIAAGAVIGVQLDPITTPAAEIKVAVGPRQEFEVISAVQLDGSFYDIGDPIFLTRAAHIELKLAGAVSGEWDERDE